MMAGKWKITLLVICLGAGLLFLFESTSGYLAPLQALAQEAPLASYTLPWYTMDSGGGKATGGAYILNATIGQPDASSGLSGGNYRMHGGFWAGISDQNKVYLPVLSKH
jgi:hypothetical protein